MTASENFYTSGGTLGRSAPSYVTRRADAELLGHLLDGEFCYVLTSRQMGKSSLMVRTAAALKAQGINVAILDLTRIGQNVSIEQWYSGLLTRLGSDLDLEDELNDYWLSERARRQGSMQRFMSALREVVFPAIKGRLVVFIDEIDAVRSLPFSSDEFFAGLRECYNSRVSEPEFSRITFCLLGVAQPSDLISNVFITPFNIGNRIELTDFTEQEAEPLLEGLRGRAAMFGGGRALLHRVLYWTGGHPYLTQKLCEAVSKVETGLTPADVDAVCEDLFLSSRSREQQDNLIFVRDRVLASTEHRASILDLYDKVHRGQKVRDDDSNTTIDPLRLSGLLLVSGGFLKVRNRIYATVFDHKWVVSNMPDAELRRQKAAYRRGVIKTALISLPVALCILALGIVALLQARNTTLSYYLSSTASAQQAFNSGDLTAGEEVLCSWRTEGGRSCLDSAHPSGCEQFDSPQPEGPLTRLKHRLEGRERLEHTFAMRLLDHEFEQVANCQAIIPTQARAPSAGSSTSGKRGFWQHLRASVASLVSHVPRSETNNYARSAPSATGCAAETAVATTVYTPRLPDGSEGPPTSAIPLVAVASNDSSVQIWSMDGATNDKPINPAVLHTFHNLQLESLNDGIKLSSVDGPLNACPPPNVPGITALSFSPDGSKLAIATGTWRNGRSSGYVLVWDMANPKADGSLVALGPGGGSSPLNVTETVSPEATFTKTADSVSWTQIPHGQGPLYLAASSEDDTFKIWQYDGDVLSLKNPPLDPRDFQRDVASHEPSQSNSKDPGIIAGGGANAIALSPVEDHLVALGYGDGHLVLYDLSGPYDKPLYTGIVHVSGIMSMTFLEQKDNNQKDGLRLVVGSRDGDLVIIDPRELAQDRVVAPSPPAADSAGLDHPVGDDLTLPAIKATLPANQGVLQGLAATYDERHTKAWLLTSGSNGTVELWTVAPDFHMEQIFTGSGEGVHDSQFCPHKLDCIVSASSDNNARLWQYPYLGDAKHNHVVPNQLGLGLSFPGQTLNVIYSPDRIDMPSSLFTAVGATRRDQTDDVGTIAIWDETPHRPQELQGEQNDLLGFGVSPDGKLIATTARTRNLELLDPVTKTPETLAVYATLGPKISIRCLSSDGHHVLGVTEACNNQYLIVGVADRVDRKFSNGEPEPAQGLCVWRVQDNGAGAKDKPRFQSLDPNLTSRCPRGGMLTNSCAIASTDFWTNASCVAMFDISDDGKEIAIARDSEAGSTKVEIWDADDLLHTGKPHPLHTSQSLGSVFANMSFSHDMKHLAATTIDSRLYYWPEDKTEQVTTADAVKLPARGQALAFSNNQDKKDTDLVLAVGLQDARILLYDTGKQRFFRSGKLTELMEIRQHHGGILGLAFSPDGNALASAGNDGLVTVLRAPPNR